MHTIDKQRLAIAPLMISIIRAEGLSRDFFGGLDCLYLNSQLCLKVKILFFRLHFFYFRLYNQASVVSVNVCV